MNRPAAIRSALLALAIGFAPASAPAEDNLMRICADPYAGYEARADACSAIAADAVRTDSEKAFALSYRARAAADANKPDLALRDAERALEMMPGLWLPHEARGWAHMRAGRFDDARGAFYEVLKSSDVDARLSGNLGVAALALEFESFVLARQSAASALQVEPRSMEGLLRRGTAAAALGEFDAGFADAAMLVEAFPEHPAGYELTGYLHHGRALTIGTADDFRHAFRMYTQALELADNPGASLLRRLSWLLATGPADIRDPVQAVDLARRGLRAAKSESSVARHWALAHHTLAVALAANGQAREAEIEFETVMELFPGARSRFQKALSGDGHLNKASSATLYELLGAIHACLQASCSALSVPLVYKTL